MRGSAIHGAALTEHVAVADLQPRRLAFVLFVLGRIPDGCQLVDMVLGAYPGRAVDDDVRTYDGPGPYLHVRTDDGERAHGNGRREVGLRRNNRMRVDH